MIINGKEYNKDNLGKVFDYAMLGHNVTREQIQEHVRMAIKYNVNGVHCNPYWLPMIADMLEGTGIETGICPAFPFGCVDTKTKVWQVEELCKELQGRPSCVDTVVNVGLLRGGEFKAFTEDIKAVADVAHSYGYVCKSILETPFLTDQEIADATKGAVEAGVDYVKAASGRSGVAQLREIQIMKENIPENVKIKHAGIGETNLTHIVISGLAMGVSLFGNGFAHKVIEDVERFYKDLVITTTTK